MKKGIRYIISTISVELLQTAKNLRCGSKKGIKKFSSIVEFIGFEEGGGRGRQTTQNKQHK